MMDMESDLSELDFKAIAELIYPTTDWADYESLMTFLQRGDKRRVLELLGQGCRVSRPGTYNTPLHLAVERVGWAYVVKQLLDNGAQVHFVNSKNDTALHHAFFCEAPDMSINNMIMCYLKEYNENLVNDEGFSYLHIACARSKLTYVKAFLEGTNVNVNSQVCLTSKSAYAGFTALHFAVEFGKIDIVEYLLTKDANIYAQDASKSTPVHLACYLRNVRMIDVLLRNDRAHINLADDLGTSHFVAACMGSDANIVKKYLIIAYRRFNIAPQSIVTTRMCNSTVYPYPGYAPLHFAAQFGCLETVKMLLSFGAFCCALTTTGETAFSLASKSSRVEICNVLQQHCHDYQAVLRAKQSAAIAQSQLGAMGLVNPCQNNLPPNNSTPQNWNQCANPTIFPSPN